MANKAISELPQAQNVNNQDLFVLEQSGIAKKLPAETFITEQGIIDALAEALDGHGGIQSVTLSSVSGRIRTYRITFTDQSATTFQVYDGTSIDRISRTSSSGLDDVYTIFLSDGTTTFFTVHNGADGTVSEAMLNDALKDKAPAVTETTESGAIANFPDGADDMPVTSLVADIEPKQDLTYGDPYPAGSGKNKLPYPYYGTSGTIDGITYTVNADGTILLNGTASARSVFYLSNHGAKVAPPSGSYILSKASTSNYPSLSIDAYSGNSWVKQLAISAVNDSVAFTLDYDGYDRIEVFASVASGETMSSKLIKPMIRLSSVSDATFAPYSNICPITGHTEVNVTRTGINVWDEEWELGYIAPSTGAKMNATDRIRSKNYIPVVGGQSYFIKMYGAAACYDRNKSYISSVPYTTIPSVGYALNIPENARYILFSMSATYGTTYNHDISINYPSSDHDYHAYQGSNTVTLSWQTEAGTVYGGTIDVATGLLTVTWVSVDLGTLNFSLWNRNSNRDCFSTSIPIRNRTSSSENIPALSSIFTPTNYNATWKLWDMSYTNANNKVVFITPHELYANETEFKTAMSGVQFVYELATPQTYQLTPQEVKTLLGTNNVWADTGDTSVTYPADTKMFIEKLTMPTEDDLVANQAITSGKYFMIGNSLYLALANIASGAQITIGTNAQRVSLADALNTINS